MANDKSTTLSVFVEAAVDRTFGKVMAKVRRSNEQLVRDTEKANDASEKAGDTNKQTASTYRKVGQAVSQCTAKVAENTAKIGKNIRKNKELRSAVKDLSAGFDDLGNKGALVAAGGAFAFQQTFVKTAAEFEKMQVILNRLEGSQDKGAQSMAWISDFAATTPYDLAQVTESFIQLKAYGLDPVQNGLLRTLGDTSAAMGKPIEQAVEAIADAVTGENERLKEFGIKARVEGDEIVYAYTKNGKEMEARADASSREMIQSTLQSIWNDKVRWSHG
ncbi:tape measure protein [Vibrio cholerae]|uniref:tape measure protein n=1 Tax=Vibrio cholerae TaxID=666 RepID=UPI00209DB89B|nr:tape measure protein [Vibrio cholerae]